MSKRPTTRVTNREMAEAHAKLDRLDEAIRGNGKPGLRQRLERLEEAEGSRRRLTWIVIGAFVSAGASAVMQLFQVLAKH
jgi:hypothetical protein